MSYKLFNPDSGELRIKVRDVLITIPSRGYAIVSSVEGIADVYNTLEITPASDKDLEDFRQASAKLAKEAEAKAEIAAKLAVTEAKAEAERSEVKIKAQEKAQEVARKEALKVKLGSISGEEEVQTGLLQSGAIQSNPVKGGKGKK